MEEKAITSQKKNFDFIDSIRGLAMVGIVFEHSSAFWLIKYSERSDQWIQAGYMQLAKFATITFFLISGFLINHKFNEYTPVQYIKNRFKNTIGPWLFWILIYISLTIGQRVFMYVKSGDVNELPKDWYQATIGFFFQVIFHGGYWFILNFLICIIILLIFKRYLYKLWLGVILAIMSLFYSVNLYYGWIPAEHTTALFGFVFYLWLGVILNKNFSRVKEVLSATSMGMLLIVNITLFVFSTWETIHLMHLGIPDPFNTLRITNIFYSLGMFALLLKLGSMPLVKSMLNPRHTTFGIYLLHLIVIDRLLIELFRPLKLNLQALNAFEVAGYSVLRFIVAYGISFMLTKLINKTKFKWSIGSR